jgi:hypothetical protein
VWSGVVFSCSSPFSGAVCAGSAIPVFATRRTMRNEANNVYILTVILSAERLNNSLWNRLGTRVAERVESVIRLQAVLWRLARCGVHCAVRWDFYLHANFCLVLDLLDDDSFVNVLIHAIRSLPSNKR